MQVIHFMISCVTLSVLEASRDAKFIINVSDRKSLHITDERFLSFALNCGLVYRNWERFNFSSSAIETLAMGLHNSVLRLGGTRCDCMFFDSDESKTRSIETKHCSDFNLLSKDWDKLIKLSRTANWTLLFDANVMIRMETDIWDPSNFKNFLDYNQSKNFSNLWFELGNEPNSFRSHFNRTITGEQLAEDFKTMRRAVKSYPLFEKSKIVGADTTRPHTEMKGVDIDPAKYMHEFFLNGHRYIDALTWHQYYVKGTTATVKDFINPQVMDVYVSQVVIVRGIIQSVLGVNSTFPLMMGETGSAVGGGAPNISDTYVAGFLWMDKLGVAAKNGYDVVIRNTFFKGSYALVSPDSQPYPDYYLSYIFKKLVGTRVLGLQVTYPDPNLRIYAHCARSLMGYSQGPVVLYGMNLSPNTTAHVTTQYVNKKVYAFTLTPENGDLQSQRVLLNGKLLSFDGNKLPKITSKLVDVSDMKFPPLTFGFFVIDEAEAGACL